MAEHEKAPNTSESSSGDEPEKVSHDQAHVGKKEEQHDSSDKQDAPKQKAAALKQSLASVTHKSKEDKDKGPAGGYDATPIPHAPPGWTVKFTFYRATNLPMADINSLSSDPYLIAQLNTSLATRHKEDPYLRYRTHTIRSNTDPEWNSEWIVANVPSSGFKLKIRLYDEDPADHDDRLGNVHVNVNHISEQWQGVQEQSFAIKKRMGSKRAYLIRAAATCMRLAHHMHGELYVGIELLGRTKDDNGGRMYTLGPCWFTQSYSPMLGRITGTKEEHKDEKDDQDVQQQSENKTKKQKNQKAQRYNFQANQMQLPGPVPAELYHRYVEFKPFVHGMFTHSGLRGFVLNKALHHQHANVYSYDRNTVWGLMPTDDPFAATKRFLELVHYGRGGRLFTYVITLDAQFRFTETGKEFGIDMLSKHSMHSDVSIYIAFSGEFFVRKRSSHDRNGSHAASRRDDKSDFDTSKAPASESMPTLANQGNGDSSNDGGEEVKGEQKTNQVDASTPLAPETISKEDPAVTDPEAYELIIDNDSGTYRPAAHLLPLLRTFLSRSFPGLHVRTLDCQSDEEKMKRMKQEQTDKKKQSGGQVVYTQRSRGSVDSDSSVSSSDEEALDALTQGQADGAKGTSKEAKLSKIAGKDVKGVAKGKVEQWKTRTPGHHRNEEQGGDAGAIGGAQQGHEVQQERDIQQQGHGDEAGEKVTADRHDESKADSQEDRQKGENSGGQAEVTEQSLPNQQKGDEAPNHLQNKQSSSRNIEERQGQIKTETNDITSNSNNDQYHNRDNDRDNNNNNEDFGNERERDGIATSNQGQSIGDSSRHLEGNIS